MGRPTYSDAEKAEALIRLAINNHNYDKTAEETGISRRSLKRWATTQQKKGVPELLERAIERMLMLVPDKWSGNHWAIALGILIDKWLIISGQPTDRIESIISEVTGLSDSEYSRVLAEAEAILSKGNRGSADSSD